MTHSTALHVIHSAGGRAGGLSELLRLLGVEIPDEPLPEVAVWTRSLPTGATLFVEGAAAEAIYIVRSGTFKVFRTEDDGYEQVLAFAGRAELPGYDALSLGTYGNAAVAIEPSTVHVLLRRDLFAASEKVPALGRAIQLAASRMLVRQWELVDVMAAVSAEVRLARFLVTLSRRKAACGESPYRIRLCMTRRDIASHLGVAHETVSRSFAELAGWGLVAVDNREVEILDLEGLRRFSSRTRRPSDDIAWPRVAHRPAPLRRRVPTARLSA